MEPIRTLKHKRHVTLRVLVIRNDDFGTRRSGPYHASTVHVWALALDYGQKFVFLKIMYVVKRAVTMQNHWQAYWAEELATTVDFSIFSLVFSTLFSVHQLRNTVVIVLHAACVHHFSLLLPQFTLLTLRSLTLYIYGAPILDVSRSHTTTQHSR